MAYILVKFQGNWADEFDVEGFRVYTQEQWDTYVEFVNKNFGGFREFYFGTNEALEYDDPDHYLSNFHISLLSDDQATVLNTFFTDGFGIFPILEIEDEDS